MKRGACHYIQKPFDLEEVDLIIRRNLDQLKRRRSLELMRQRPPADCGGEPGYPADLPQCGHSGSE